MLVYNSGGNAPAPVPGSNKRKKLLVFRWKTTRPIASLRLRSIPLDVDFAFVSVSHKYYSRFLYVCTYYQEELDILTESVLNI